MDHTLTHCCWMRRIRRICSLGHDNVNSFPYFGIVFFHKHIPNIMPLQKYLIRKSPRTQQLLDSVGCFSPSMWNRWLVPFSSSQKFLSSHPSPLCMIASSLRKYAKYFFYTLALASTANECHLPRSSYCHSLHAAEFTSVALLKRNDNNMIWVSFSCLKWFLLCSLACRRSSCRFICSSFC
jgi:hypothetical protein